MSTPVLNRNANSAARLAAVQALYEIDVGGSDPEEVLTTFKETRWPSFLAELANELADGGEEPPSLPPPDRRVLRAVVRGAVDRRDQLDAAIKSHMGSAEAFEQLEALAKAILRAAAFEMAHSPQVPAGAIVSDYVAIANAFFTENQPRLVNAIVDALGREYRGERVAVAPQG
jgi:N utilization substance protein B